MPKEIILPDGKKTTNDSQEYMRYCEAITILKWKRPKAQRFLQAIRDRQHIERADSILRYIRLILQKRQKNGLHNSP